MFKALRLLYLGRSLTVCRQTTRRLHFTLLLQSKVIQAEHQQAFVNVRWKDGSTSRFPFVYLREKCLCESCYHSSSQQRLLHMKHLDLASVPTNVLVKENGGKIEVHWHDDHVSEFPSKWLYDKRLSEEKPAESLLREGAEVWDKNFKLPSFEFDLVLNDDQTLLEWTLAMYRSGVAKMIGVPRELGQIERLGDAVGFLKNTFYGETVSLRSDECARSLAYTSYELQPHTDLPYYEFKPSVIFLHFIEQVKSDGGVNTLADGFNIIQHFKQEHPRFFELMVNTPVLWQIIGREPLYGYFRMTFTRPVIEIGWTRKVARINYNEPLRENFVDVPASEITEVYHAYQALTNMFYEERFVVKEKMAAGEMLTIDNDRLLHGRSAFKVDKADSRWLQQAYVDWDVLRSKTAVLKEKLQKT